eukprot:534540_1
MAQTERSNLLQDVFIVIDLTLQGYAHLVDCYNLIQSGLLGTKWETLFPANQCKLINCLSPDFMHKMVQKFLSKKTYSINAKNYEYKAKLCFLEIDTDVAMGKDDVFSFISLYFVAIHLWKLTFGRNHLNEDKYLTKTIHSTEFSKHYHFDITGAIVKKYFTKLKVSNAKSFESIEGRDLRLKMNAMTGTELRKDWKYELYAGKLKYHGVKEDIKDISMEDMKELFPNKIGKNDFSMFNVDCKFIEYGHEYSIRHQFLFQRFMLDDGGRNFQCRLWMNGGIINWSRRTFSDFGMFVDVWDSLFINHPLIGETLRNLWDEGYGAHDLRKILYGLH